MVFKKTLAVKRIAAVVLALVFMRGTALADLQSHNDKNKQGHDQQDNNYYQNEQYYNQQNQNYNFQNLPIPFAPNNYLIREIMYRQGGGLQIRVGYPLMRGNLNNPGNHYGNQVRWNKNQRVIVRDSYGRAYKARVVRINGDRIELAVEGLRRGQKYRIEIPGLVSNNSNYLVKGDFWAKDNWKFNRK